MKRIAIIDDEPDARQALKTLVNTPCYSTAIFCLLTHSTFDNCNLLSGRMASSPVTSTVSPNFTPSEICT